MPEEQPTRDHGREGALPAHERADASGQGNPPLSPVETPRENGVDIFAHTLVEGCPCGLAVLNNHGKIIFTNGTLRGMVGRTEDELLKLHFHDLLPMGGKLFYETQFTPTLLLRSSISEIAFDLIGSEGTRVPVLVNACLHQGPDPGSPQILLGVFGAKQRRLYEKELLRARKEFEQIAEVVRRSSDAILRLTSDGIVRSWNTGASQIFGLSPDEAIGKPLVSFLVAGDSDAIESSIAKLKTGQEAFIEVRGMSGLGKQIDLSVSMTPHMEAPGLLVAFSAIIRDITTRKLAERALLQNEKLASVGRLASSISHEINNPLEAVTNLLYLLELRVEDEQLRSLVTAAQRELNRVSHIATHTLRFYKQSSNQSEVDLGSLAGSVLELYQVRFANSGVEVVNDSTKASPFVCFEGELRQVLFNLVSNAFDAMRHGGRLIIRCRDVNIDASGQKGVRISVADNGSGMDKETIKQIFEPFFTTKGFGGTGLGLWITRDLVKKSGGTIRVRSSSRPGKSGTVVMIVFPHPERDNWLMLYKS